MARKKPSAFEEKRTRNVNSPNQDIGDRATSLNDADAKEVIVTVSRCKSTAEFQSLEQGLRNQYIKEPKRHGLSIRQISR